MAVARNQGQPKVPLHVEQPAAEAARGGGVEGGEGRRAARRLLRERGGSVPRERAQRSLAAQSKGRVILEVGEQAACRQGVGGRSGGGRRRVACCASRRPGFREG